MAVKSYRLTDRQTDRQTRLKLSPQLFCGWEKLRYNSMHGI